MPTNSAKARGLLNSKKATLVQLHPYTIKLKYEPDAGRQHQPIIIGLNPGSKHLGIAATQTDDEGNPTKIVYVAEAKLRDDVTAAMEQRLSLRRGKRARLRYRPARWLNRGNSIRRGRLAPTAISKLQAHQRVLRFVNKYLPVSKVVIELNNFDTQKMMNPNIKGIEYQQGTLMGYLIRGYLQEKFNNKCAYCGDGKAKEYHVEHVVPKSRGGSDSVRNLVWACAKCDNIKQARTAEEFGYPEILAKAIAAPKLRDVANTSAFKWALWRWSLATFGENNVSATYGHINKFKRSHHQLNLPKSDANDAIVSTFELSPKEGFDGGGVTPQQRAFAARGLPRVYSVWFRSRVSRQLADSMPNSCHVASKKVLRTNIYSNKDKFIVGEKLLEKGVKDGWLRKVDDPTKLPKPTKQEALQFYNDAPGYQIVRHRKTNAKGEFVTNPNQYRRPHDTAKGRFQNKDGVVWRKGYVFALKANGRRGVVTGIGATGQFNFAYLDGGKAGAKIASSKLNLVMRRKGITHWPSQLK